MKSAENLIKCGFPQMICDTTENIDIRKLVRLVGVVPDVVHFGGERLVTTWTETNFGGRRQWFLCPSCDRRCAIIYRIGDGPLWGCRICRNGRYATETMSPRQRRLRKAIKIRKKLGQKSDGLACPFPEKPKGMHQKTYFRLKLEARLIESEVLTQMAYRVFGTRL